MSKGELSMCKDRKGKEFKLGEVPDCLSNSYFLLKSVFMCFTYQSFV